MRSRKDKTIFILFKNLLICSQTTHITTVFPKKVLKSGYLQFVDFGSLQSIISTIKMPQNETIVEMIQHCQPKIKNVGAKTVKIYSLVNETHRKGIVRKVFEKYTLENSLSPHVSILHKYAIEY